MAAAAGQAPALVTLAKAPAPATISAGDAASFLYVVQCVVSTSSNVTLTDTLPAGVVWTDSSSSCAINGTTRLLSCSFGTMTPGSIMQVTVAGATDYTDCGSLESTATLTSSSNGTQASAAVLVLCPDVIDTAVPDSVTPSQPLAITVAVRNQGLGIARSVHVSFPHLDPGLAWTLEPPDALCDLGPASVECALGDLGSGLGHSFRVAANAPTEAICGPFAPAVTTTVANAPEPYCCISSNVSATFRKPGDVDGSCTPGIQDVFYLINFLFAGGPDPLEPPG